MFVALLQCYIVQGFADQWVSQPIILQRNTDHILTHNETTCSNPVQPDDQTTYLQAPAPVVLGPQYCPKYRVSINQKPHHLSCLCSPTLALPQPSYASGCLAESGLGKVHWVGAVLGPQYDQAEESDHAHHQVDQWIWWLCNYPTEL